MKRILIITALFLGFSVVGFSQTEITMPKKSGADRIEVIVTDKMQVTSTETVYGVKDINTGLDYESFPTQAQMEIGEHVACLIEKTSDTVVKTYLQEKGCSHTEFTFEIIGRSIPENTSE